MSTTAPAPGTGAQQPEPSLGRTAGVLIVGVLAVVFDTTIMSVALHTLSKDLNVPVSTIQWVTTGYVLALAATVPLSAWIQRLFGGKRAWMFALGLFLLGSVLCSLAWNAESLIAFRIIQGIGGGIMLPLMQTIVMQAAGGKNLGRIAATIGLPAMLGPILGPAIGGIILNWLDWRWIFWVNVPFCVVGLILAWRMLPKDVRPATRPRLDVIGMVLLLPSLVLLLLGLSNSAGTDGFAATDAWLPLTIGAVLLAAFVVYALMRGDKALVDVRLLRHRSVWSASSLLFLSGIAAYGIMLLLPLYLQQLRGRRCARRRPLPHPTGRRHAGEPVAGRSTHGCHRRPLGGSRRFRDRRPRHHPVRVQHGDDQRVVPDVRALRARIRTRSRGDAADGGVVPGTESCGHPALQHHHAHRAAARRLVRHGGAGRHPAGGPDDVRRAGHQRGRHRLRPGVLVVDRVHGAGRGALPRAARSFEAGARDGACGARAARSCAEHRRLKNTAKRRNATAG
ncbi:DHA2 family efflux MFS transporter permease subunit [Humibacter ginsenosidimutans]|uniref:DHA2 family efflux MFS transporter permease subunit n=1 Tax=Humibacter ginsenosidimutans TaxID=2599293 RepID=UPI00349EEAA3